MNLQLSPDGSDLVEGFEVLVDRCVEQIPDNLPGLARTQRGFTYSLQDIFEDGVKDLIGPNLDFLLSRIEAKVKARFPDLFVLCFVEEEWIKVELSGPQEYVPATERLRRGLDESGKPTALTTTVRHQIAELPDKQAAPDTSA